MSRHEWRSLFLLLALAVGGHLVRAVLAGPGDPPGSVSLFDPSSDGDPAAQADKVEHLMKPIAEGERVDAETASAAELGRLPGVGPALAARIVADRQSHGAFGGISGLDRVPGIGPAILTRLAPMLQFGQVAADIPKVSGAGVLVDLNRATAAQLDALPGIGPVKAQAIVAFRDSAGPFRELNELLRVPGMNQGVIDRLAGLVTLP